MSFAAYDPFGSPLSCAVAPVFAPAAGAVSAEPLAGEFIGAVLSAFGDGAALSAFGAAAGASPPFMPVPWANAEPAPMTNVKAATELNSEFFMCEFFM
jgi:hypothetical protein